MTEADRIRALKIIHTAVEVKRLGDLEESYEELSRSQLKLGMGKKCVESANKAENFRARIQALKDSSTGVR
jgi:hypothetical protein